MNKKIVPGCIIVLLTYMYGPFYFARIRPLCQLFYYGIAFFPLIIAVCRGIKINERVYAFFVLFLLYVCAVFYVMLITGSLDFVFLIKFVRAVIVIFSHISVFFIYQYVKARHKITGEYYTIFFKAISFYILGTIVFISFPQLKEFWRSIIVDNNERDFSTVADYITRFGFSGFSGFSFAFFVSSNAIILAYAYINNSVSERQMHVYVMLMGIGSLFYGRIGLVITAFTFAILSFYSFFIGKRKLLFFFLIAIGITIALLFLVYIFVPDFRSFIDWALEPLLNFLNNGKIESRSTNGLLSFYKNFHPDDKTLFIGDGYWENPDKSYYGHTDVGFMRNIYYGGVFYTALQYCIVLFLIFQIGTEIKRLRQRGKTLIPFFMVIQFVLFELKGDVAFRFLAQYIPVLFMFIYTAPRNPVPHKNALHIFCYKFLSNRGVS